jgi:pimeloyl-ACP methyl ester carboxylesterase
MARYFCAVGVGLLLASAAARAGEPNLLLKAAVRHPIRYYLSLPEGYERCPGRRWPVLLCLDGAASNFAELARRFVHERRSRPFLVVVPCTFSNTTMITGPTREAYRRLYPEEVIRAAEGSGWLPDLRTRLAWDEAGVLALLDELAGEYDAEPRAHLTAFSGGGPLAYHLICRHPDRLAGAALVCANFHFWAWDYRSQRDRPSPEERDFRIRILLGEKDDLRHARFLGGLVAWPWLTFAGLAVGCLLAGLWSLRRGKPWPRILGVALLRLALVAGVLVLARESGNEVQSTYAERLLTDLEYPNVRREVVPRLAHEPAPKLVLERLRWPDGHP